MTIFAPLTITTMTGFKSLMAAVAATFVFAASAAMPALAKKGDPENIIRKTTKTKITITPISEWSEVRMDVFNKELEEILDEIPSI